MPKSSTAQAMPASASRCSASRTPSSAMTDSVISTISRSVRQARVGQRRRDRRRQVLVLEDGGGQVDRDRQVEAFGGPARSLVDRLLQHPRGQRVDQAALLGQRDELARRDDAPYGMHPAHQRLDVLDPLVLHVDQRLVVQRQLTERGGVAQLGQDRQPVPVRLVGRGVVERPAAAGPLGAVHRDVRALEQHARLVAVLAGERDADAGGERDRHLGQVERLLEAGQQLAGDRARLDRRVQVGQADGELVAAETGHRVRAAQGGAQPFRDLTQQQVAGVVAERVVDVLEPVEVEQQQTRRCSRHAGPRPAPARAGRRAASGWAARSGRRAAPGGGPPPRPGGARPRRPRRWPRRPGS